MDAVPSYDLTSWSQKDECSKAFVTHVLCDVKRSLTKCCKSEHKGWSIS